MSYCIYKLIGSLNSPLNLVSHVNLPYLLAAIRMLETTDLALTMPARIAGPVAELHNLVSLRTPKEIPPIRYSMVWHPRFETDPLYMWLR
jgi:hypothetical protein